MHIKILPSSCCTIILVLQTVCSVKCNPILSLNYLNFVKYNKMVITNVELQQTLKMSSSFSLFKEQRSHKSFSRHSVPNTDCSNSEDVYAVDVGFQHSIINCFDY
jgi:hypothetical protein